jgi:prepilin-type N-terminal cleavage/methylation domain-containing protein
METKKYQIGFTLIELLVTISIIGLLSTTVLVSVASARTKARDAKRKANASQILLSIELYFSAHDIYPNGGTVGNKDKETDIQGLANFLTPAYLGFVPNDPSFDSTGDNYEYVWNNSGKDFGLFIPFSSDGGIDCMFESAGADDSKWFKTHGNTPPLCTY